MSTEPRRIVFEDGQLLTAADLRDEQLYHLTKARRHRIGAHRWGIVQGLALEIDAQLNVQPGYAVDGFGRDIILDSQKHLQPDLEQAQIRHQGAGRFVVAIHYTRRQLGSGFLEEPIFEVAPKIETPPPFKVYQDPPDDPNVTWPVPLGELERDREGAWHVLQSSAVRREAGLVASCLHPPGPASNDAEPNAGERLELTDGVRWFRGDDPKPVDDEPPDLENDLEPEADGNKKQNSTGGKSQEAAFEITAEKTVVRGELEVDGGVELAGPLEFEPGTGEKRLSTFGIERYGEPGSAPDTQDLRIVLPSDGGSFTVGYWDSESDSFVSILEVAADRSVTVHGDLLVEGFVEEVAPGVIETPDRSVLTPQPQSGRVEETEMVVMLDEAKKGVMRYLSPIAVLAVLFGGLATFGGDEESPSWACSVMSWVASQMGGSYRCGPTMLPVALEHYKREQEDLLACLASMAGPAESVRADEQCRIDPDSPAFFALMAGMTDKRLLDCTEAFMTGSPSAPEICQPGVPER